MVKKQKRKQKYGAYAVYKGNTKKTYAIYYGEDALKRARKDYRVLRRLKIKSRVGRYNPEPKTFF